MTWKERIQSFFMLNALTIISVMVIAMWLLLHHEQSWNKLGRLVEIPEHLENGWIIMLNRFETMRNVLLTNVLTTSTSKEASLVIIISMLAWFLVRVMGNLSLGYAILVCYAWSEESIQRMTDRLVLFGYIFVNVCITLGFLAEHSFLSKRYLIAMTLVFMLFVPFALNDLITKSRVTKKWNHRFGLMILLFMILISSLGGVFHFGYSKSYIRQAGDWLAINIPQNASLYINDITLMYLF